MVEGLIVLFKSRSLKRLTRIVLLHIHIILTCLIQETRVTLRYRVTLEISVAVISSVFLSTGFRRLWAVLSSHWFLFLWPLYAHPSCMSSWLIHLIWPIVVSTRRIIRLSINTWFLITSCFFYCFPYDHDVMVWSHWIKSLEKDPYFMHFIKKKNGS